MQLSTLVADLGGRGWHPGMLLVGIVVPLAIIGLVTYGIWELASSRRVAPTGPAVATPVTPLGPLPGDPDATSEQPATPAE
jgi:hypothetical protein